MKSGTRVRLAGAVPILLAVVVATGCSSLISNVTEGLATDLSAAILENPDVDVVREGAPAYLILIDGLLESTPDNVTLLSAAAMLNSAYAGAFVADEDRARLMSAKAKALASGRCAWASGTVAASWAGPMPTSNSGLRAWNARMCPWSTGLRPVGPGGIQAHSDDFNAIAELGRVKALIARVADLDEGYDYGGPHLYLGVFEVLLPPALGGRPEIGRYHFERAIALSEGAPPAYQGDVRRPVCPHGVRSAAARQPARGGSCGRRRSAGPAADERGRKTTSQGTAGISR